MSDPSISQAKAAYDLLLVFWDDPSVAAKPSWLRAVHQVYGPSTAPCFSSALQQEDSPIWTGEQE